MEHEPAAFWSEARLGVKGQGKLLQMRFLLEEQVLAYLMKRHPDIHAGHVHCWFLLEDAKKFSSHMKKDCSKLEYLYKLRFLIKGLEAGKANLGWKRVTVPSMPFIAPREPARFTPKSFNQLLKIQHFQTAFLSFLEERPKESPTYILGTILISAVLHGGLLSSKWLTPLLRGLPNMVRVHGSLLWLELQRPYIYPKKKGHEEKRKYIHRRWFPDPLTSALIVRLHRDYGSCLDDCSKLDAQFAVNTLLQSLKGNNETLSIKDLYLGAICHKALRIPGFLVNYATGKTPSVSLPPHVWARLLTDKAVKTKLTAGDDEPTVIDGQRLIIHPSSDTIMIQQNKLRKQLSRLLLDAKDNLHTSDSTRRRLVDFLEANSSNMFPVLQMIVHWTIELLTRLPVVVDGRKKKTALRPSSVANYFQSIENLIACAGNNDITNYETDEFRDLYDDVIKSVKGENKQTTTSVRIALFHKFLVRSFGVADIDLDGIMRCKGPPELSVDANLVSPGMYHSVLRMLGWEVTGRDRIQTIRCLVTTLGYRCALRRMEALCLKIGDLVGETSQEILIRPSYLNRLKTPDSCRRIPIYLLLEPDELETLMQWKELRIAEEGGEGYLDAPLFSLPGNRELPDVAEVFTPITNALRVVTGDPACRYHHLRHSLPNILLLKLMSGELESISESAIKRFVSDYPGTAELKSSLFGNMVQGRQFLFGISSLLGHADPSTTLLSYIHLCDWILGQFIRRTDVQPELTPKAIMQITGLKQAMVFRTRAESQQDKWLMSVYLDRLFCHSGNHFPDPYILSAREVKEKPLPITEKREKSVNWQFVAHALKQSQENDYSVKHIAQRLRLPVKMVHSWISSANIIRNLTTSEGSPRHLTAWQRKQEEKTAVITKFPMPPESSLDKKLVSKIFKKVSALSGEELSRVKDGCREFITGYSTNQGFVKLHTVDGAVRFRCFLDLIGVPREMIYVSMFTKLPVPSQKELDEQQSLLKLIKVSPSHLVQSGKRHVRFRRHHECSVAFFVARDDRPINRKGKQVLVEMLYGFRYAVYLLAIGLDAT